MYFICAQCLEIHIFLLQKWSKLKSLTNSRRRRKASFIPGVQKGAESYPSEPPISRDLSQFTLSRSSQKHEVSQTSRAIWMQIEINILTYLDTPSFHTDFWDVVVPFVSAVIAVVVVVVLLLLLLILLMLLGTMEKKTIKRDKLQL